MRGRPPSLSCSQLACISSTAALLGQGQGASKKLSGVLLFSDGADNADLSFDERDSAPFMPKSVVVDPDFDWKREKVWRPVP